MKEGLQNGSTNIPKLVGHYRRVFKFKFVPLAPRATADENRRTKPSHLHQYPFGSQGKPSTKIATNNRKQTEVKMVQNLPDDMIIEILSRLPAKSLHRFRCVCQLWLSVLCPHFIRSHSNPQKLCILFNDHYSIFYCYEAPSFSDFNASMVKVEYPFKDRPIPYNARILTSCDSWLLLSLSNLESRELMFLNPLTREYKRFSAHENFIYSFDCFGICYDRSDNDYRVIQVRRRGFKSGFTVFSFKTNSWTRFRPLTRHISCGRSNVVSVNGAMHWVNDYYEYTILSFYSDGELKEVPQPGYNLFDVIDNFCLGAVRGNLWLSGDTKNMLKVFEMKQYGLKESWVQVCSFKSSGLPSRFMPLACTKKGDVIIQTGRGELLIYNLEDDKMETLMKFEGRKFSKIAAYSDNPVTLNCDCSHRRGSTST